MTYKIPKYCIGHDEYPTMLEALSERNVFAVTPDRAGGFVITEACDQYYEVTATPEQLRALGEELIALANAPKKDGPSASRDR